MGRFDENGENDESAFYPLKTGASLHGPPKTTKVTKMAGVTQAKAWFGKSLVCSSLNCGGGGLFPSSKMKRFWLVRTLRGMLQGILRDFASFQISCGWL